VLPRDLVELRVAAPELVTAALVAGCNLDLAHRQRSAGGADPTESVASLLGGAQQVEIELDRVDPLHAPDILVPPGLVCVDERARPLDARAGIDDLVAVDLAPPTFDLVLRPERELDGGLYSLVHDRIVVTVAAARKT